MRYMWLALWAFIQLFFISCLSVIFWKVTQILRIVRRHEKNCRLAVAEVKQIEASISNGH